MTPHPLILVSLKVLLKVERSPGSATTFRRLSNLTRHGAHLLLTASEPDRWFPTRGHQDERLGAQGRLMSLIQEAGGDLDGVYYVPRSMFTQERNRIGALEDILARYNSTPSDTTLVSSSRSFLRSAEKLGIRGLQIPDDDNEGPMVFSELLTELDSELSRTTSGS